MSAWSPIARMRAFVAEVCSRRDLLATLVASAAVIYILLSLLLPVAPGVVDVAFGRFHRRLPFEAWAVLQPWPAMYNFDNQLSFGPSFDGRTVAPAQMRSFYVNHHTTAQIARVLHQAPSEPGQPCAFFVQRSTYRGQQMTTALLACPAPEGSTHEGGYVLTPVDARGR